jgi:hypothetical protein
MKRRIVVFLLSIVAFALAGAESARAQEARFTPHPSTQDPSILVTLEKIKQWETELSNWGRWGPRDQRGTLNLITPEKSRTAARLVKDGVSVSLGLRPTRRPSVVA